MKYFLILFYFLIFLLFFKFLFIKLVFMMFVNNNVYCLLNLQYLSTLYLHDYDEIKLYMHLSFVFFAIFYTFTIFYHFLLLRFPKITETKSSGYLDTYYSIFTYSGYFDIFNYMINFSSITEYMKKLVVLQIIVSSIYSMW